MDNALVKLYKTPQKVFTNKDLALVWEERNADKLYSKTNYYVKKGDLVRLSRGILAKENYEPRELGTSFYTPSYISFETALRDAGIIFQYYETIFVASKWPKNLKIGGYSFCLRKMKDSVLYNREGIIRKDNYSIATPERAFLDMIYLFPNYYFDNLRSLDWDKCFELVKIYNNKQLEKRLNKYKKDAE